MKELEICWNITARCNHSCNYCHRFLNIAENTYEENLKILNNLILADVKAITWTGGEALLVDGLDKLLAISHEHGIKNKLITNGKLLTQDRIINIIKYLDNITLSIDSTDNEINEKLGRGKEHYSTIKNILDYIKANDFNNVKININSVANRYNLDSFSEITNFLNNYNIDSWRIFKFMPLREKAILNSNQFSITSKEFDKLVSQAKLKSNIKNIQTRVEEDMENKYILILADGSIVITENGIDKTVGNAKIDSIKKYI